MLTVKDLGLVPYREAWELQKSIQADVITDKNREDTEEHLLLVEHPPVFTLGRHGHAENMLVSEDALAAKGIEFVRIERGGDITFHGPGQLVAYPIIDLQRHHLGVKDYVNMLEEAVIRTIAHYGITGERVDGATGVWIDKGLPGERKICAIGVKCTRFVTMHGLALNINTDLHYFGAINPCGFIDKGVTSVRQETGKEADMQEAKELFAAHFRELLK